MSLEAHPSKTVHVVCGDEVWRKAMRKQMDDDPAQIQNFKIKTVDEEEYLGVRIVEGTVEEIIDANIKIKASKVHLVGTVQPT